jgi:2-isopropylmalate synthase
MHVDALQKCEESYQQMDPRLVGNSQRVVVSELSGKAKTAFKAQEFGLELPGDTEERGQVLQRSRSWKARDFRFRGPRARWSC